MGSEEKKERMISVVLEMIKDNRMNELTSRKIAEYANVNPAMINYHFGSKSGLIEKALSQTSSYHLVNPILSTKDPRKAIFDILLHMCECSLLGYATYLLSTTHPMRGDRIYEDVESYLMKYFKGTKDQKDCFTMACRIVGGLMSITSDPELFFEKTGIDLNIKSDLRSFVSNELDILFENPL